jgi:competence protein ComEA
MSHSLHLVRAFANFVTTALVVAGIAVSVSAAGAPGGQAPAGRSSKGKAPVGVVNINPATSAELQTLPGIGAATAARILEYRQKNGGFKKLEDIMNIRGIGEKSFLKLKPLITITPPKAVSL